MKHGSTACGRALIAGLLLHLHPAYTHGVAKLLSDSQAQHIVKARFVRDLADPVSLISGLTTIAREQLRSSSTVLRYSFIVSLRVCVVKFCSCIRMRL